MLRIRSTPVEHLLAKTPRAFLDYDLVVSAVGNPTVELFLNEYTWKDPESPTILFSWLEPHGLGGHAILSHLPWAGGHAPGCLECIYDRSVAGGSLENRAAFAQHGVGYTRDVTGCGSRHLPFGDLDAHRTAEVACRLAIDALLRVLTESPVISWKGDAHEFRAAGYHTTPRFDLDEAALAASRTAHIRESCPVCAQ